MASNQVNLSKYKMDHEKRGIALIINISEYEPNLFDLKERDWSIKDVENLKKTLEYLEFDIEFMENFTKLQIEECLKRISTNIKENNFDCFLCVVMSHGMNDSFATYNSELMSFEEIMSPIKSCKTLEDKPKMFFFQACRGEKEMESTPKSGVSSAKSVKGAQMTENIPSTSTASKKTDKIATNFDRESNLLIYNSTLPDHYALTNNVADGSIFIQSFCDVFNECAYKNLPNNLSLAQMITKINKSVSKTRQQISVPEFRMSKEVYFWPKNVSQF